MIEQTIKIAEEFNKRPSGRYLTDGKFSGEAFRESLLYPALEKLSQLSLETGEPYQLVIDFTGVTMTGSSFLEEAFGGLIRKHKDKLDLVNLLDRIKIDAPRRATLPQTIYEYMRQAISVA